MTQPRRYRPEHRPPARGPVIVMNTGMTRLTEGDWSILQPDGTRQRWTPEARKAGHADVLLELANGPK